MLKKEEFPNYIKYMGSKSKIIDFVVGGINKVREGNEPVLDLFAGSASLAGAIGKQTDFYSNDIQTYSAILSDAYTKVWRDETCPTANEILSQAEKEVAETLVGIEDFLATYSKDMSLGDFVEAEEKQRKLLDVEFDYEWHLFLKYYSGTWWSAQQCLWIDAIRRIAEDYKNTPAYPSIMASLMFAMAYCSQGTGHYAQYRDATSQSSMNDIMTYRHRDISVYFKRKYEEAFSALDRTPPANKSVTTSLDFKEALDSFEGGIVYADPPYCFVHYSRFYHALETLVLYDFPELQIKGGEIVKGRYRVNRHQSPFSIRSKVVTAFKDLFMGVTKSDSRLVLSYSNTGMIGLDELSIIAQKIFRNRPIELLTMNHQHMTLGRQGDRHRDVQECLLLV